VEDKEHAGGKNWLKMQNWRHYSMKIHLKRKKNLQNHCELLNISMRLKALGMIQKQENWVPHELKPRDLERHFFTCEGSPQRQKRKDFLHRIVTGDEKWIPYDNPKRKNGISPAMHQHPR